MLLLESALGQSGSLGHGSLLLRFALLLRGKKEHERGSGFIGRARS